MFSKSSFNVLSIFFLYLGSRVLSLESVFFTEFSTKILMSSLINYYL